MRVLDAGIWRPVPHATQMLADLGAEVLKIEPPGGDPMRTFPQLFRDIAGHKRSIELDLRSAGGKARALELAAGADVFCEGWRPGVAARLGLSYEDIRVQNPSIIYCSVSGYGQTGPNVARPGHDVNYQALAGARASRSPTSRRGLSPRSASARRGRSGSRPEKGSESMLRWPTSSHRGRERARATCCAVGRSRRAARPATACSPAPTAAGSRWRSSRKITFGRRCVTGSISRSSFAIFVISNASTVTRNARPRLRRRVRA